MKHGAQLIFASYVSTRISMAFAQANAGESISVEDLQGTWWSNCAAPAAEFAIHDTQYSGDFEGSYKLNLTNDLLTFSEGFADGHSVNVRHESLSFRIVELTNLSLTLRSLSENPSEDWHLRRCTEEDPDK